MPPMIKRHISSLMKIQYTLAHIIITQTWRTNAYTILFDLKNLHLNPKSNSSSPFSIGAPSAATAISHVNSGTGAATLNLKVCSFMICYFPKFWILKFWWVWYNFLDINLFILEWVLLILYGFCCFFSIFMGFDWILSVVGSNPK